MSKKYDLAVKVGEYTGADGKAKGRYQNVGVVMDGQNGPYILLNRTFNPAGVAGQADRESIIISMFEPRDDSKPQSNQSGGKSAAGDDSDIPF
jgi:hypothetical protein